MILNLQIRIVKGSKSDLMRQNVPDHYDCLIRLVAAAGLCFLRLFLLLIIITVMHMA